MKLKESLSIIISIVTLSLLGSFNSSLAQNDVVDDEYQIKDMIYHWNSKPYGHSYEEWAENWFRWILSLPSEDNPYAKGRNNGLENNCYNDQAGPVWFLQSLNLIPSSNPSYNSSLTVTCIIPEGKSLLIPIGHFKQCSTLEDLSFKVEELDQCVNPRNSNIDNKYDHFVVTIDGKIIPDLEKI